MSIGLRNQSDALVLASAMLRTIAAGSSYNAAEYHRLLDKIHAQMNTEELAWAHRQFIEHLVANKSKVSK